MNGDLPFLDEVKAEEEEAPQAPEPEAKGEPQPEPKPEPAPPAVTEDTGRIPIAALLDEREKRKEREREAEDLRKRLAEYEAKQQPKPDFYADPEAALNAAAQAAKAAALNTKLEFSRFSAEKEFGADEVKAAYEFFDRNPHLSGSLLNHPSPFHKAVEEYRVHSQVEKLRKDPNAYEAEIEARLREKLLAEMAQQPKPTAPPPGISTAPSSGTKAPVESGFKALFGE